MSMKKLADEGVAFLEESMSSQIDSRCATDLEIYACAMGCRIQELEEMLEARLDLIKCGIATNYSGNPYENELYTTAKRMLEE